MDPRSSLAYLGIHRRTSDRTDYLYQVSWRYKHHIWLLMTWRVKILRLGLFIIIIIILPSVLWRCWLGGRKGIRPVKTEWWGAGVVICLEQSADLHVAQLMPLPLIVSCYSKIQIGFTFQVPAHPGSPGKRAVKRVCVCIYHHRHFRLPISSWHAHLDLHIDTQVNEN